MVTSTINGRVADTQITTERTIVISDGSPHFEEVIQSFVGGEIPAGVVVVAIELNSNGDISVKFGHPGGHLNGDSVSAIKGDASSNVATNNTNRRLVPGISTGDEPFVSTTVAKKIKRFDRSWGNGSSIAASVTSIGFRINTDDQRSKDDHLVLNTENTRISQSRGGVIPEVVGFSMLVQAVVVK